jgi:class 3 adenylate cyclase
MGKDAISKWSGEFLCRRLEQDFRSAQSGQEVRQIQVVWSLALVCFVLYAPMDLWRAGSEEVWRLGWPRLFALLSGCLFLLALRTNRGRLRRDGLSSLVLFLVMTGYGWIIGLRPGAATGALLLILVGSYLFSPCRFAMQIATGVFGSLAAFCAAWLAAPESPLHWQEFSYLVPGNLLAALALARANHSRRFLFRQGRLLAAEIETRRATQRRAERLHRRNLALLYNALPERVARQLQSNPQRRPAWEVPEVTVLFADIVGFSDLARSLSARRLVQALNMLFTRFDLLAGHHRLEKIKTIGDAYLAVAGMGVADAGADRAVEMALSQQREADDVARRLGIPLQLRIGLHCGPVVAGVLGNRRFAFDVWGASVNIASRLQAAAPVGGILASAAVCERCAGSERFGPARVIQLRGCGTVVARGLDLRSAVPQLPGDLCRDVLN